MNGILYIASGRKYYNEAVNAIKRTKKIMPSVPIALCTDWKGENKCKEIDYLCIITSSVCVCFF